MQNWQIKIDSRVKRLDEAALRERIRERAVTGLEMACPRGTHAWAPLHTWPIYQEELGTEGSAFEAARRRGLAVWLAHLGSWVAVLAVLLLSGVAWGESVVLWGGMAVWGTFVMLHWVRVISVIQEQSAPALEGAASEASQALAERSEEGGGDVASPSGPAPGVKGDEAPASPAPVSDADPFLTEVKVALEAVREATLQAGEGAPTTDLESVARAAKSLHSSRQSLAKLINDDAQARLEVELSQVRKAAEAADAVARDTLLSQAEVIDERLDALARVKATVQLIHARERTLLHQLEALRMNLVLAAAHRQERPDLSSQLRAIRGQLEATGEVDAALAQARQVAVGPGQ